MTPDIPPMNEITNWINVSNNTIGKQIIFTSTLNTFTESPLPLSYL